jgi:hypothetical protein
VLASKRPRKRVPPKKGSSQSMDLWQVPDLQGSFAMKDRRDERCPAVASTGAFGGIGIPVPIARVHLMRGPMISETLRGSANNLRGDVRRSAEIRTLTRSTLTPLVLEGEDQS